MRRVPCRIAIANSDSNPRIWLACVVRWRTNPCGARWNDSTACCSSVLTGTTAGSAWPPLRKHLRIGGIVPVGLHARLHEPVPSVSRCSQFQWSCPSMCAPQVSVPTRQGTAEQGNLLPARAVGWACTFQSGIFDAVLNGGGHSFALQLGSGPRRHPQPHGIELPHKTGIAVPSFWRSDLLDLAVPPKTIHATESRDAAVGVSALTPAPERTKTRSVEENVSMAERIRRPGAKSAESLSLTHERANERRRDVSITKWRGGCRTRPDYRPNALRLSTGAASRNLPSLILTSSRFSIS